MRSLLSSLALSTLACSAAEKPEPPPAQSEPATEAATEAAPRQGQGQEKAQEQEKAVKSAERIFPASLADARSASVRIRIGSGGCSATRVTEDLLLSAAHCVFGVQGGEMRGPMHLVREDREHLVQLVEYGEFAPHEGKLDDWMLLWPNEGPSALEGIAIAKLAKAAEIDAIVHSLPNTLTPQENPVWAITYPSASKRLPPRAPLPDNELFASFGYLKSESAYKQSAALALTRDWTFDDLSSDPPPELSSEQIELAWQSPENSLRGVYEAYKGAGMPILYHSADYSPGSSGGGIFDEKTGSLLGFVPMGTSLVSRNEAYPGLGQLFRVDVACRQSERLRKAGVCGPESDAPTTSGERQE